MPADRPSPWTPSLVVTLVTLGAGVVGGAAVAMDRAASAEVRTARLEARLTATEQTRQADAQRLARIEATQQHHSESLARIERAVERGAERTGRTRTAGGGQR